MNYELAKQLKDAGIKNNNSHVNKERWRVYNRRKQREYRVKWRKEHPLTKAQLKQEEIFRAAGG